MTHPSYSQYAKDWIFCRDFYKGEEHVKLQAEKYLPRTMAQIFDWNTTSKEIPSPDTIGKLSYSRYVQRAGFFDGVRIAVEGYLGMLHRKPPQVTLPEKCAYLTDKFSATGDNLLTTLRLVNEEQLVTGRCGLLVDVAGNGDPYVAFYNADTIVDWHVETTADEKGQTRFVVLDESGYRVNGLTRTYVSEYRHLVLHNGVYKFGVSNSAEPGAIPVEQLVTFSYKGQTLNQIPFTFINIKDNSVDVDKPPLLPVASKCATIYRTEADYRQTLHQQGQDTLVVKSLASSQVPGAGAPSVRVGTGAMIEVEFQGDAKYIGASSTGLPEQRLAITNDKMEAMQLAGQLAQTNNNKEESGASLSTRLGTQTSILQQIANTGAQGLAKCCRIIAGLLGANEQDVNIVPNNEFIFVTFLGQDLLTIVQAIKEGAPLSAKSIHRLCQQRGLTVMSFEDEQTEMSANPIATLQEPENKSTTIPGV